MPDTLSLTMNRRVGPIFSGLAAWFCFAVAVGISGTFRQATAPVVAATVWVLTALVLLGCWRIRSIRDWITVVDLRRLIAVHLTRFVGIYFLVLGARRNLPNGFALPAGIGDIAIATSALLIVFAPQVLMSPRILLVWNVIGLVDIVFVVFSALRFGLRDLHSMAPLRELPLSLLPTFIVPLIITSHVLIFVRLARSGPEGQSDAIDRREL
jgi:hypothetical protein